MQREYRANHAEHAKQSGDKKLRDLLDLISYSTQFLMP